MPQRLLGFVIGVGGGLFKARTADGILLGVFDFVEARKRVASIAGLGSYATTQLERASLGEDNDDQQESYRVTAGFEQILAPSEISGLRAWYRGDDVTLAGTSVSSWNDKSGTANHATQGVAAQQPVYNATDANFGGKPSLTFTRASSQFLSAADNATLDLVGEATFMAILRRTTTAGEMGILVKGSSAVHYNYGAVFVTGANGFIIHYNNAGPNTNPPLAAPIQTTFFLLVRQKTGEVRVRVGPQSFTRTATLNMAVGAQALRVGADASFGVADDFLDGQMAEVALWAAFLSDDQVNALWRYATLLYGTA